MNVSAFISCIDNHAYAGEVLQDYEDGVRAGVSGTPTFFFNGAPIPGSIPADVLRTIIEKFLSEEV